MKPDSAYNLTNQPHIWTRETFFIRLTTDYTWQDRKLTDVGAPPKGMFCHLFDILQYYIADNAGAAPNVFTNSSNKSIGKAANY
jgi:hypothetical protein